MVEYPLKFINFEPQHTTSVDCGVKLKNDSLGEVAGRRPWSGESAPYIGGSIIIFSDIDNSGRNSNHMF